MTLFRVYSYTLPMGSCDSPLYFQGAMSNAFKDFLSEESMQLFIEDLLAYATTLKKKCKYGSLYNVYI